MFFNLSCYYQCLQTYLKSNTEYHFENVFKLYGFQVQHIGIEQKIDKFQVNNQNPENDDDPFNGCIKVCGREATELKNIHDKLIY